jgi:hypothetical protein
MSVPNRRLRVGLYIEGADGTNPLEAWILWAEEQFNAQAAAISELMRNSTEAYNELAAVRAGLNETQALIQKPLSSMDDIQRRMDYLDQRLNKILALFDDKLGGGQTEEGMLHHSHAKEYLSLVEQQIGSLAVDVFYFFPRSSPRDKAWFIASVCHALFGSPEVRGQEVMAALPGAVPSSVTRHVGDICAEAQALREKVALSRSQVWDFDHTPGSDVDPDRQTLWVGSVADGVVDFVVAPAYVVDSNKLLEKQWVFTVPRPDPAVAQEPPDRAIGQERPGRAVAQESEQPNRDPSAGEDPHGQPDDELNG